MLIPGDWVTASRLTSCRGAVVNRRRLYQVANVQAGLWRDKTCPFNTECACDGIRLVRPILPEQRWWCSSRFRLVYRPKAEVFRGLLRVGD